MDQKKEGRKEGKRNKEKAKERKMTKEDNNMEGRSNIQKE